MNEFDPKEEKAGKPEPSSAPQGERQVPHLTLETDLPEDQPQEQDQHFPGSSAGDLPHARAAPGSPASRLPALHEPRGLPAVPGPAPVHPAGLHPVRPAPPGLHPARLRGATSLPSTARVPPTRQPYQQPYYQYVPTPPPGYHQKSRMAAGLLAILLGVLGVHNFYLGFTSRGVVQLVVSLVGGILTCGTGHPGRVDLGLHRRRPAPLRQPRSRMFDGNGVSLID